MKFVLSLLFICLTVPAFAAEKECHWVGGQGSSGSKGDKVQITVSKSKVTVKSTSDGGWPGTYKRTKGGDVDGKDKHTYMDFAAGGDDGCTSVLVDERLVKENGKGLIKFRCRGEGFMEDKFACGEDDEKEE